MLPHVKLMKVHLHRNTGLVIFKAANHIDHADPLKCLHASTSDL